MTTGNGASETNHQGYVIFISCVAALGGLLFGYDTAVISGTIGFLQEHFDLTPFMTGWAASCALLGCVAGAASAGILSDRYGRKNVLIVSAVLFFVSALGTAIPNQFTTIIVFRVIGGIGVGIASMTSPMYIAEIVPAKIRGAMVTVYQLAIIGGILVVYFVNYFIAGLYDDVWNVATGWRWMFGSEALPALVFLALMFIVPKSPRWLAKQGRPDEALAVLTKITGPGKAQAEMREIEKAIAQESASFWQIFTPGMRKALFIGVALAVLQQANGINVFMYYAPEIFKKMGSDVDSALLQTIIVGITNVSFTLVALWAVDRFGRRPLLILGAVGMGMAHLAMALAFYAEAFQGESLNVSLLVLEFTVPAKYLAMSSSLMLVSMLLFIASFASTYGPCTWVLLSEIYPTQVRGRVMSIAVLCLWFANYIVSQTFPMMIGNPWLAETFHNAFPFLVYAAFCGIAFVFAIVFIPETKGRTLEEIERWWT